MTPKKPRQKRCRCPWCRRWKPIAVRVRNSLSGPLRDDYDALIYHMVCELKQYEAREHERDEVGRN